jgi:hypothetical protein
MENKPLNSLKNVDRPEEGQGSSEEVGAALEAGADGGKELNCFLGQRGVRSYHTPFRERGNEASIRVLRMFKSYAWQQYDKQMQCYE